MLDGQITMLVKKEVKEKLQREAEKENRTLGNYIRRILEREVDPGRKLPA